MVLGVMAWFLVVLGGYWGLLGVLGDFCWFLVVHSGS